MRLRSLPLFVAAIASLGATAVVAASSDTATGQIVVTAQFATRTSIRVSTHLLQFDVATPGGPATFAVDFSAGARTASGAEVVLSVEPLRALEGSGGAADVLTAVSYSGIGEGTTSGALVDSQPSIAGRWTGSGLRTGRLVFVLRAAAPGTYLLPVRFVLSTP